MIFKLAKNRVLCLFSCAEHTCALYFTPADFAPAFGWVWSAGRVYHCATRSLFHNFERARDMFRRVSFPSFPLNLSHSRRPSCVELGETIISSHMGAMSDTKWGGVLSIKNPMFSEEVLWNPCSLKHRISPNHGSKPGALQSSLHEPHHLKKTGIAYFLVLSKSSI